MPPPDTPVMQVNTPSGISAVTSFRLLARAPTTFSVLPLGLRRFLGIGIWRTPVRYCPVMLSALAMIASGVPWATMCPPWMPAPGPMSTT